MLKRFFTTGVRQGKDLLQRNLNVPFTFIPVEQYTMENFRSAYHRCHLNAKTAVQTCTQLPDEGVAVVALRLSFGGRTRRFEFCVASEEVCDLTNTLLHCEEWNPSTLHAPVQHVVPKKKILEDNTPPGDGRELVVGAPVDPRGYTEISQSDWPDSGHP